MEKNEFGHLELCEKYLKNKIILASLQHILIQHILERAQSQNVDKDIIPVPT